MLILIFQSTRVIVTAFLGLAFFDALWAPCPDSNKRVVQRLAAAATFFAELQFISSIIAVPGTIWLLLNNLALICSSCSIFFIVKSFNKGLSKRIIRVSRKSKNKQVDVENGIRQMGDLLAKTTIRGIPVYVFVTIAFLTTAIVMDRRIFVDIIYLVHGFWWAWLDLATTTLLWRFRGLLRDMIKSKPADASQVKCKSSREKYRDLKMGIILKRVNKMFLATLILGTSLSLLTIFRNAFSAIFGSPTEGFNEKYKADLPKLDIGFEALGFTLCFVIGLVLYYSWHGRGPFLSCLGRFKEGVYHGSQSSKTGHSSFATNTSNTSKLVSTKLASGNQHLSKKLSSHRQRDSFGIGILTPTSHDIKLKSPRGSELKTNLAH
ncbi:hypothetical protein AAMO2058_001011700 [Amorphochlora amoebiformis]